MAEELLTEKNIPVKLSLEQWNYVLNVLSEKPFKEVASVLINIEQQARAAIAEINSPRVAPPPIMPDNPNLTIVD